MQARLEPRKVAPDGMKAVSTLNAYVHKCGLDHKLLELIKLRASQINGCAWCMDMHTKELRVDGRPNSVSISSARGENVPFIPIANVPRSPGQRL